MTENDLKSRPARGVQRKGGEPPAKSPNAAGGPGRGGRAVKRTTMVLYSDALKDLQYLAVARETNVSALVRAAIDEWLAEHRDRGGVGEGDH